MNFIFFSRIRIRFFVFSCGQKSINKSGKKQKFGYDVYVMNDTEFGSWKFWLKPEKTGLINSGKNENLTSSGRVRSFGVKWAKTLVSWNSWKIFENGAFEFNLSKKFSFRGHLRSFGVKWNKTLIYWNSCKIFENEAFEFNFSKKISLEVIWGQLRSEIMININKGKFKLEFNLRFYVTLRVMFLEKLRSKAAFWNILLMESLKFCLFDP